MLSPMHKLESSCHRLHEFFLWRGVESPKAHSFLTDLFPQEQGAGHDVDDDAMDVDDVVPIHAERGAITVY